MNDIINIIKRIIPSFNDKDINTTFNDLDIESIDLVSIRVEIEKYIRQEISDRDWLDFKNFQDVIIYYKKINPNTAAVHIDESSYSYIEKTVQINMPQMAIGCLGENWLLKEIGSLHWEMICKGININSSNISDELGNRLYATFVRIRIETNNGLYAFKENEIINIEGKINRYGNSLYFSKFEISNQSNHYIKASLVTSFALREASHSNNLVKSQPYVKVNHINNLNTSPNFINQYRRIKKEELKQITISDYSFEINDKNIARIDYELNPFYDLNGANLLYFAAYPIINDQCESKYFNKINKPEKWETKWSTFSRDILYYSNCDIHDSIIYELNHQEVVSDNLIKLSSSLYRKSDNKLMAKIFTLKKKR